MTRLARIRADLANGGVFYGAAGPMTLITKEDVAWLVETLTILAACRHGDEDRCGCRARLEEPDA